MIAPSPFRVSLGDTILSTGQVLTDWRWPNPAAWKAACLRRWVGASPQEPMTQHRTQALPPYHIRPANPGDRPGILSLLRDWIRGRPIDVHYRYLYESNPDGPAVTWVAEDPSTGQVVGCTSCFPRRLSVGGTVFLGSFGGDTLVHPNWRGRGIAVALHRFSNEDLPRAGLGCHYGFPMEHNRKALKKAGFAELQCFRSLHLPLSAQAFRFVPARLADRLLHWRTLWKTSNTKMDLAELPCNDAEIWSELESLWAEAQKLFSTGPVREASFFRWRYEELPGKKPLLLGSRKGKRLESFAALIRRESRYTITDFFARNEEATRYFLAQVPAWLRERGAKVLSVTMNSQGPYYQIFRRTGFVNWKRNPLCLYVVPGLAVGNELSSATGWHLMRADFD